MVITFTVGEIIALCGLGITAASVFATILWNVWGKVMDIRRDLSDFKLEVAKNYASFDQLAGIEAKLLRSEERLLTSMGNLTSRIDKILERLDKKD